MDASENDGQRRGMPPPHGGQKRVLDLPGRFRVAVCGRRFGKTVAAAIHAVTECERTPALRAWWISPVQEQSDRVEREMYSWVEQRKAADSENKERSRWLHRKSEHALVCDNGSRIEFHSAHVPDRLRGAGLDLVIVDEAADVSDYTWKMVLKPMLLEKNGRALILGTPRGTQHWLHRVFLLGQHADAADAGANGRYASIQLPTSANENLDQREIEAYRLEMSEDEFRQEFEAQFIDGVDSVFKNIDAAVEGLPIFEGRRGEAYITGIDLGDKHDFTVLCSVACGDERIEGFSRFNKIGWHEQLRWIEDHLKRFPGPVVVDSNGVGDPIYEGIRGFHRHHVEAFKFNAATKENIVRALQMGFDSGAIKLAKIPVLVDELKAFAQLDAKDSSGGPPRFGAPPGLHDDCVMALALAWYGLKKRGLWGGHSGNPWRERGMF